MLCGKVSTRGERNTQRGRKTKGSHEKGTKAAAYVPPAAINRDGTFPHDLPSLLIDFDNSSKYNYYTNNINLEYATHDSKRQGHDKMSKSTFP